MNINNVNKETIKKGIKDSFIIKINEGENPQKICEALASQFYQFIIKKEGFSSSYVSRGMREFITEENREAIITSLGNSYLEYINKNNNFNNKYDNYVKDILESSGNIDKLMKTILSSKEMIYRMRKSSC